ncbi:hypothetical protein A374_03779 [Fictibacillus macauensis ZFHKF-1]|uniref:DUF4870 domain-containing protein n=1 Tax=Fictibacillus macauensis ZFHKF-1 TaxID=1196324 RepID=I8UIE0_9BACL|nr:DUF4870 domain-containing protein [Fictibacillus macauensis]EIT86660.1 hypothetical protein A374_03779 [Fictibacillus macauensis ZFHKF-1]
MEHKGAKVFIHASTWFAPIIIPLIIFLLIKSDEVRSLAIQAVIFHFVMGILIAISAFFSWVLIGLPFLILFSLVALIAPIIGIVRALQDQPFSYPIIGSWFK